MDGWRCSCHPWQFLSAWILLSAVSFLPAAIGINRVNEAIGKYCNQSSYYSSSEFCNHSINGNTLAEYSAENCIHTKDGLDDYPYWAVDLGQVYNLDEITVFARGGFEKRMTNVTVSVDDQLVYRFPSSASSVQLKTRICHSNSLHKPSSGRVVTLARYNKPDDDSSSVMLNFCELQVWVCPPGKSCLGQCAECGGGCLGGSCDPDTGYCNCSHHWKAPQCQVCADGQYGTNCSEKCAEGCQSTCDQVYGNCTCEGPQWQAPFCSVCADGLYGANCSERCGEGCQSTCDKVNGTCTCRGPEWQSPFCSVCAEGQYGTNCSERCGEGCQSTCDQVNGTCICRGPQWQPPFCLGCAPGHYGPSSDCLSTCAKGCHDACDGITGNCTCGPEWEPQDCTICRDGYYGDDCKNVCGPCANNTSCNKTTGHCPASEGDDFDPPFWRSGCESGLWGPDCSLTCGQCGGNGSCHMDTGDCLTGPCLSGWTGPQCMKRRADSYDFIVILGASSAAAVLIILLVSFAVFRIKRRRRPNRQSSQIYKLSAGSHCQTDMKTQIKHWDNDLQSDDAAVYSNIVSGGQETKGKYFGAAPRNGKLKACKGIMSQVCKVGSLQVYENVLAQNDGEPVAVEMAEIVRGQAEDEELDDDCNYNHDDLYACYTPSRSSNSVMDSFQKYLLECLASPHKLQKEFAKFPKGMPYSYEVANQQGNSRKNRFKKLAAYDKNRVMLKRPQDETSTDYINASYIKGYRNEKAYIATQGPRANTLSDLWWMTWQENVRQIIMLTKLKEDGKEKCVSYWPAVGNTVTYGHLTVMSVEEIQRADFVVRRFIIRLKEGCSESREVQQYHYTAWPDHGVPTASSLINFWRYVTARATTTVPPIIHCCAGVGRTGTYIALDIAMERKIRGLPAIVREIVTELRDQRCIMVQSEVQYKFLHEVILEAYSSRGTRMTVFQLDSQFPDDVDINKASQKIDKEFKMLSELKQWAKPHHQSAELQENRTKNRESSVLPDERHIAYLNVFVRGRNQYINAVFMSSFTLRKGLLLTQLPLHDTAVDLWRLVEGCNVRTIVSLGSKNDEQTVKNFCQYWPHMMAENLTFEPYALSLDATKIHIPQIEAYEVTVKREEESFPVTVLHYMDWVDELPGHIAYLIQMMETLKTHTKGDTSPIVIQCLDGATRSGLFCVLYDIFNRVMQDEEVDVFSTVRYMHSIRPQAVKSEIQYRYCYRIAQEVKRNLNVYANTVLNNSYRH